MYVRSMEDAQNSSEPHKAPQYHLAIQCGSERCVNQGVHWIRIRPWEFPTAPNFDPALVLQVKCDRCGEEFLPRARFLLVIDENGLAVQLPSESAGGAS